MSEPLGHLYSREFGQHQQLGGQAEHHQSALHASEPPGHPYGRDFGQHQQLGGQLYPPLPPDHLHGQGHVQSAGGRQYQQQAVLHSTLDPDSHDGQVQGEPQLHGGLQYPQQAILHSPPYLDLYHGQVHGEPQLPPYQLNSPAMHHGPCQGYPQLPVCQDQVELLHHQYFPHLNKSVHRCEQVDNFKQFSDHILQRSC